MTEENEQGGEIGGEGDKVAQRTFQESQGQGQEGQGGGNSQSVPYERFQEVNGKYRDLESKYAQIEATLKEMQGRAAPDAEKEFEGKFYKNPVATMKEFVKSHIEELKAEGTQREQAAQRSSAIEWFKKQPDYSPELEEKAARFITENGLQGLDPHKAIKLAYQFSTMGDGSGYTRTVKEGLRKPGAGGRGQEQDLKSELAALDPKDENYDVKMKALHAKMTGGK